MALTGKQRHHLRGLAHALKPVIIIGAAGLSEAVVTETDVALTHHELIKVRINAEDREARRQIATGLCDRTGAELVQSLGNIVVLYRPSEKRRIPLP